MKPATLFLTLLTLPLFSFGQMFIGATEMPSPSASIAPLSYYGEAGQFDGGYQIDDQVANFQAYTTDGEAMRLGDFLGNGKYTILSSGNITCERFTDTFDTEIEQPGYQQARTFMNDHLDDFNWVWMYTPEAHPFDSENCMSNCQGEPILAPNGDTIYQHQTYGDRLEAALLWESIVDDPNYTYDFPFEMLIDNPDNRIFDFFFERPYGIVVLDCTGTVVGRGDWTHQWLINLGGATTLLELEEEGCQGEPFPCTEGSTDIDEDGICDDQEMWQGWDHLDNNDPYETETVSVADMTSEAAVVKIYPNPASDFIFAEIPQNVDQVTIISSQGQTVREYQTMNENIVQFDLSGLASGTYFVRLWNSYDTAFSPVVVPMIKL